MATVRPFRAIRPRPELASRVITRPYDVMDRDEARRMAEGNDISFLHISRSEIDFPDDVHPYDQRVYDRSRDNIVRFMDSGVLTQDKNPGYYIYRMTYGGRSQTGVIGCFSVDEYADGTIKRHEKTRFEKEKDRIRHFDTCSTNTEPVLIAYRDERTVHEIIERVTQTRRPAYDFKEGPSLLHTMWIVDNPLEVEFLRRGFESVPCLYIADGHHRCASAFHVAEKRRQQHPGYDGQEEFNYVMAAFFPGSEMEIMAYNRVVKDMNGLTEEEFLSALESAGFDVEDIPGDMASPDRRHIFGVCVRGNWYRFRARKEIIPDSVIGGMDVSILQDRVLAPILGIEDPTRDRRIDFVGGARGIRELTLRAETDMELAFALYPTDMEELMAVADAGLIMPPKSTWFEPKPCSGLVMHHF